MTQKSMKSRSALLARMDNLMKEMGPVKRGTARLVKEGRRR